MDHYRHPELVGQPYLLSEQLLLLFPVVCSVIEVETYLAYGKGFGVCGEPADLIDVGIGVYRCVIRMDPDCGPAPVICIRVLECLLRRLHAVGDIDNVTELRRLYLCSELPALFRGKLFKIQMCMSIKKHF